MYELFKGDCLEVSKQIPEKSIDLQILDPPYNIGKAKWDKWKNNNDYIEWMGKIFLEVERTLKDNGSFYFFHNDFEQMARLQNWIVDNTNLKFKSLITIDKNDNNYIVDLYGSQNHFRNYLNLSEYCLFYVNQKSSKWDKTGLEIIKNDINNFQSLRQYFKEMQEAFGLSKKQIIDLIGQSADHCFRCNSSQWDLPTKETYSKLKEIPLKIKFIFKEYEELRLEYEELRLEYEELRYTFNGKQGIKNIWNYTFRKENKYKHPTQKPIKLLEDIILYSSKEGQTVSDFTMGSGSTGIAALNTGRKFIGIEKDENYFEIAKNRIENHIITKGG